MELAGILGANRGKYNTAVPIGYAPLHEFHLPEQNAHLVVGVQEKSVFKVAVRAVYLVVQHFDASRTHRALINTGRGVDHSTPRVTRWLSILTRRWP